MMVIILLHLMGFCSSKVITLIKIRLSSIYFLVLKLFKTNCLICNSLCLALAIVIR